MPRSDHPRRHIPLSVVVKPTGAACNLDCTYCFFLSKELLYSSHNQRLDEETLDAFVRSYLDTHPDGEVTFLWQGGEPTMRGLPFFATAFELAERYRRPGQTVRHALQTNATLLTERWAELLAAYDVLVGVSMDGPAPVHDTFRVNRAGRGTHAQVLRGWRVLEAAGVRRNLLCTVHAGNQHLGREVYTYFRDELGAEFIQFIPIVERVEPEELARVSGGWNASTGLLYQQNGTSVTDRSVDPHAYGAFLLDVFEEWRARDIGTVFVQDFDSALSALFGQPTVCVHAPECGNNLAMEFNGDVYACDHWVEPEWLLGNVNDTGLDDLVGSPRFAAFSRKKRLELPATCRGCDVRPLCHGGCPKDRFVGEAQENYLCAGYHHFYSTILPDLIGMARLIQSGRSADEWMHPHVRSSAF
ncbi:anaerobic sulfatase maturase [Corynebacterium uterequi]|nr:anaerobic sulfatase maturase [Corynebacterium uterequi]